jgi:hypothetical protein
MRKLFERFLASMELISYQRTLKETYFLTEEDQKRIHLEMERLKNQLYKS